MDNYNLPESDNENKSNEKDLNLQERRKNRRKIRRNRKVNLESQLTYFQESRQKEQKSDSEKQLSFYQIVFLFFTITPLFFSLAIFLSKTIFKEQLSQINVPQQSQESLENTQQDFIQETVLEPRLPQLPNTSTSTSLFNQDTNNNLLNQEDNQDIYGKPQQNNSEQLDKIVESIILLCQKSGLSTENLSITLLDVNTGVKAGYQYEKLRYPASVVKIFWLVAAINYLPQTDNQEEVKNNIEKMIKQSDNDSSGYVVDWLTNTTSGEALDSAQFQKWSEKRKSLNKMFSPQYGDLDITHKTFPLPKQNYFKPEGRDLQLRGGEIKNPTRNKISTDQTTWLMYGIITNPEYIEAKKLLTTDLATFDWKDPNINYFNPVMGLFAESLPTNIEFVSKAGWTTQTRQEVAYISTKDGKTRYILAVFAEDPAYSKDKTIFPTISKKVFELMSRQ